jgi:ABC-type Fe3+/spermidine/putrescine transport system ATPase subunit
MTALTNTPRTTQPTNLVACGVSVRFKDKIVLENQELVVNGNEIVCLVGPSGVGKSTLLRVIAGLIVPETGSVTLDGTDITGVPTFRRNIGMLFQDLALFPHLNVRDNIAFGLKMRRVSKSVRLTRTKELLDLVGLGGFESRNVQTLSGGEQQRVALARALAPRPRVLLFDEPLSALDPERVEALAKDIRTICKQHNIGAVYVSHDEHEVVLVSDRVVRLTQP